MTDDPTPTVPLWGVVAAIDPGRSKCGLVLADCTSGQVLDALVVAADETESQLKRWHQQTPLATLVLGNGTSSDQWKTLLQALAPVRVVDESGTTLRARSRYWELWPCRGWRRLLPQGLRVPACELDAIAALVLLEDHVGHPLRWPQPPMQGPGIRSAPVP